MQSKHEEKTKNPEFKKNYAEFKRFEVTPALAKFQTGVIDDCVVRHQLLLHAQAIQKFYKSKKLPLGSVANYVEALQQMNALLDKRKKSSGGYKVFRSLAFKYVRRRLMGSAMTFPEDVLALQQCLNVAKKDNVKREDGKNPLFQVTTQAEADFVKLILDYVDFFILKEQCKAKFDNDYVEVILHLPIKGLLTKWHERHVGQIDKYEHPQKFVKEGKASAIDSKLIPDEKAPTLSPRNVERSKGFLTRWRERKELVTKKARVVEAIDDYMDHLSELNFYGKKRALELTVELGKSDKSPEEYNKKLNAFLKTGKTESDRSAWNFFRSPTRCSSETGNSLRAKIIEKLGPKYTK